MLKRKGLLALIYSGLVFIIVYHFIYERAFLNEFEGLSFASAQEKETRIVLNDSGEQNTLSAQDKETRVVLNDSGGQNILSAQDKETRVVLNDSGGQNILSAQDKETRTVLNESEGENILSVHDKETGMHLLTNYPLLTETPWIEAQGDTNKSRLWQRQLEIEEVLQRNLNNTLVTTVHLLVNQPSAEQRLRKLSLHNEHKIVVRSIESLPKYKDFFVYINEELLNRFVVMLNMDIYIGEGFELLNKTFLAKSNICYVLTRHGRQERKCNMSGGYGYCGMEYIGSHDTYIFVLTRPLSEPQLAELNYDANVMAAENRLIWLLRRGLHKKLLNPCKVLKTYHSHCIDIHGRNRPRIKWNVEEVPLSGLYA